MTKQRNAVIAQNPSLKIRFPAQSEAFCRALITRRLTIAVTWAKPPAVTMVAEIKTSIDPLSPRELRGIEASLHPWPDADRERQMGVGAESDYKWRHPRQQAEAEAGAGPLRDFPGEGAE